MNGIQFQVFQHIFSHKKRMIRFFNEKRKNFSNSVGYRSSPHSWIIITLKTLRWSECQEKIPLSKIIMNSKYLQELFGKKILARMWLKSQIKWYKHWSWDWTRIFQEDIQPRSCTSQRLEGTKWKRGGFSILRVF